MIGGATSSVGSERRATNAEVGGSSPSWLTEGRSPNWIGCRPPKAEAAGSSPARPTARWRNWQRTAL